MKENSSSVVPKLCSADPLGSAKSSQGISGYVSEMDTLKRYLSFNYRKSNRGTSLIGDVYISYGH
jgi:hypothetical protein